MSSLPDNSEPFQKRMSFSATDVPSLPTVNTGSPSNSQATIERLKLFGSRFSSLMTRQAAPTFTKLTTQGALTCSPIFSHERCVHALAKLLPINETVSSLLKVIGESPSLIRSTAMKTAGKWRRRRRRRRWSCLAHHREQSQENVAGEIRSEKKRSMFFPMSKQSVPFTRF